MQYDFTNKKLIVYQFAPQYYNKLINEDIKKNIHTIEFNDSVLSNKDVLAFNLFLKQFPKLEIIDFSGVDTSNCSDLSGLFKYLSNIKLIKLSKNNLSRLIYMDSFCKGCTNLKYVLLPNKKAYLPHIISAKMAFFNCQNLYISEPIAELSNNSSNSRDIFQNCKIPKNQIPHLISNYYNKIIIYTQKTLNLFVLYKVVRAEKYTANSVIVVKTKEGLYYKFNADKTFRQNVMTITPLNKRDIAPFII